LATGSEPKEFIVRTGEGAWSAQQSNRNGDNPMDSKTQLEKILASLFGIGPRFNGGLQIKTLQDAYQGFTGDHGMTGHFNQNNLPQDLRARMDISSGTFPLALASTLNTMLSMGYRKINYFESALISQKMPINSYRPGGFAQMGYWGDLPDVDPEAADYPNMAPPDLATSLFEIAQRGGVIRISEGVIRANNTLLVQKIMEHLGMAARKAHARYVWKLYQFNGFSNDGTPWFSAEHGNLGSAALSIEAVTNAITTLATMQEFGESSDMIGLDLSAFKWSLVVPTAKWMDAVKVNQTKATYVSNDLTAGEANPVFKLFGERNERIVTPPILPENAGWGILRDPSELPIVEMQYLDGKEEPEVLYAADKSQEGHIRGDWFAFKCRHSYGGGVSDHRGGYKSLA
jgi:hypothetical protein